MDRLKDKVTKSNRQLKNKQFFDVRNHVVGLDVKVPLLNGNSTTYINFDNAASTPPLQEVMQTINNFMPWYSSVHRGTGFKSLVSTEAYEQARQTVGEFFGANKQDHVVIFGKNSTEALNKLSYRLGLKKGDVVLVSLLEHHSNDLPWRRQATVKRIRIDSQGRLDEEHYDRLLNEHHGRIKLVAVTGGSNVTGHMPNIHQLAAKAHRAGAQILVDCAQLAPHRKVDIKNLLDPEHLDYIVISAHKMYAPFGTGALIGRRDTFETGAPELCGGGTIDLVTTSRVEWTSLPDKDEAGSPNVVGAVALASSLRFLSKYGMNVVARHEAELTNYALNKLAQISGIEIFGDSDPETASKRLGVIPFKVKGLKHSLVAAILGTEWGIGVRSGCFCAHPYVTRLLNLNNLEVSKFAGEVLHGNKSSMPGLVRVSFGMYNTPEEVDYLTHALKLISAGKYQGKYAQDKATGEYLAAGWRPKVEFLA
ncbi:MAG TPA: aminotransferase class V-fold PLP-dependent enzyme [Candidatus Saccharimonadales bacterium]|nr:aminotransferase class V-fold PLP-dependent enzyme [Candidatus Saccharimonadales bacterium]